MNSNVSGTWFRMSKLLWFWQKYNPPLQEPIWSQIHPEADFRWILFPVHYSSWERSNKGMRLFKSILIKSLSFTRPNPKMHLTWNMPLRKLNCTKSQHINKNSSVYNFSFGCRGSWHLMEWMELNGAKTMGLHKHPSPIKSAKPHVVCDTALSKK